LNAAVTPALGYPKGPIDITLEASRNKSLVPLALRASAARRIASCGKQMRPCAAVVAFAAAIAGHVKAMVLAVSRLIEAPMRPDGAGMIQLASLLWGSGARPVFLRLNSAASPFSRGGGVSIACRSLR